MKKIFVLVFISLVSFVHAGDRILDTDGDHWIQMDESLKLGVVFGYVLAMSNTNALVEYLKAEELVEEDSIVYFDRLSLIDMLVGDVLEKVNEYYASNDLETAIWIVIHTVVGSPPDYVITGEREPHFEWMRESKNRK